MNKWTLTVCALMPFLFQDPEENLDDLNPAEGKEIQTETLQEIGTDEYLQKEGSVDSEYEQGKLEGCIFNRNLEMLEEQEANGRETLSETVKEQFEKEQQSKQLESLDQDIEAGNLLQQLALESHDKNLKTTGEDSKQDDVEHFQLPKEFLSDEEHQQKVSNELQTLYESIREIDIQANSLDDIDSVLLKIQVYILIIKIRMSQHFHKTNHRVSRFLC